MKVIGYKQLDDCVGGNYYNEIQFDRSLDFKDIEALKGLGELEFHRDFARPYFQLRSAEGYMLKGLHNDDTCRLILLNCSLEYAMERIKEYLGNHSQ